MLTKHQVGRIKNLVTKNRKVAKFKILHTVRTTHKGYPAAKRNARHVFYYCNDMQRTGITSASGLVTDTTMEWYFRQEAGFLFSPQCLDWLWDPPSPCWVDTGGREILSRCRAAGAWSSLRSSAEIKILCLIEYDNFPIIFSEFFLCRRDLNVPAAPACDVANRSSSKVWHFVFLKETSHEPSLSGAFYHNLSCDNVYSTVIMHKV
jgi:hypothetical protein